MGAMSRTLNVKDVWLVEYKSLAGETLGKPMARWSLTEEGAKGYAKCLAAAHYNVVLRLGPAMDYAVPKPWFYRPRRWLADARWRSRVRRRVE